jgi:hypothetical protein
MSSANSPGRAPIRLGRALQPAEHQKAQSGMDEQIADRAIHELELLAKTYLFPLR